ncbi:GNAT family N-acetyltransferase [Dyella flava]|uniref:GNAT family N-acetyltransferase n=1 Tax=Dyella flava TaxID=1920170 RepID=A0ABS2JY50_9GAMM|nr:GNAT family N-acetyltransferase [Dyella flava]MBM7123922.1 GNAT family N-acetyltransferase [Dyella flava]
MAAQSEVAELVKKVQAIQTSAPLELLVLMEIVNLKDRLDYVPELVKLHFDAWGYLQPEEDLDQRMARMTQMCRASHMPRIFIALDAGTLIGSAGIKATDALLPDLDLTPWLMGVYVKAQYRSRGIAAMLVSHVEQIALDMDFSVLHLCTHDHEAYYRKLGYEILHTRESAGEMISIMVKQLR